MRARSKIAAGVLLAVAVMVALLALPDPADADGVDPWAGVIACESGGNPTAFNGIRHWGLFQFDQPTWDSNAPAEWVGVRPDRAPVAVQYEAAETTKARRGLQPWECGYRYGDSTPAYPHLVAAMTTSLRFGRSTDTLLSCDHDGDGARTEVAVRDGVWFLDLAGDGGAAEAMVAFGRVGDTFTCVSIEGRDWMVARRGADVFLRGTWSTGVAEVALVA